MKKQRHLVLTNSRSGSTYFNQLINSSPEAVNYGEIYLRNSLIRKYSANLIRDDISAIYSSRYLLTV